MVNYRIFKIAGVVSSATASVASGDNPPSGSALYPFKTTWGIMTAPSTVGHVSMSGGGAINLAHITSGTPLPCFPTFVSCSSGTVYILG